MTKRVTITCVVAIAMLQAAAPARATIGSVISSFGIDRRWSYGIYREGTYVYLSQNDNNRNYLRRVTTTGSFLSSVRLTSADPYSLRGGSRTHLGAGYVAFYDYNADYLKIFSTSNGGAPVTSFRATADFYSFFWDGDYYYFNRPRDRSRFVRYSSTGGSAGSWTCTGWPGSMTYCYGAEYAKRGNRGAGPYFVAGSGSASRPYCMTTFPGGSLVRTWTLPSPYLTHLSYGDSSNPGVFGAAIWATTSNPYTVYEVDIDARGASSVLPASLGKVKAIYR